MSFRTLQGAEENCSTAPNQLIPHVPRNVSFRTVRVRALREAGIPVVLRIDPLFPRSPLPTGALSRLADFGLVEAQTLEELENLVSFAKSINARQ